MRVRSNGDAVCVSVDALSVNAFGDEGGNDDEGEGRNREKDREGSEDRDAKTSHDVNPPRWTDDIHDAADARLRRLRVLIHLFIGGATTHERAENQPVPLYWATPARRMPSEGARVVRVPVPHSFPSTHNRNHNHFGRAASGR